MIALSFSMLILLLCGAGFGLIACFQEGINPGGRIALGAALGLGLLSLLTFALCALNLYNSHVLACAFFLLFLVSIKSTFKMIDSCYTLSRTAILVMYTDKISAFGACFLGTLLFFLHVNAYQAIWSPDAIEYHMTIPKLYWENGGFLELPHLLFSNFPMVGEMIYINSLALGSDILSQHFNVFALVICVFLSYSLFRRHIGRRYSLVGCSILVLIPGVYIFTPIPHIDIYLMLFGLAAWLATLEYERKPTAGAAALFAVFVALLAGTKMVGYFFGALYYLMFMRVAFVRCKTNWIHHSFVAFWVACGVFCIWPLKSLWYTGNPVYPFAYPLFGGRHWSMDAHQALQNYLQTFQTPLTFEGVTSLTRKFFISPDRWLEETLGGVFLIPLLLLTMPEAFRKVRAELFVCCVGILATLQISAQTRYLSSILPLLVLLVLYTTQKMEALSPIKAICLKVGVFAHVAVSLAFFFMINVYGFLPLFGLAEFDYKKQNTLYYKSIEYINTNLPRDVKILMWRSRGYYLDRPFMPFTAKEQGLINRDNLKTSDALYNRLHQLGVTHIIEDKDFYSFAHTFPEFINENCIVVYETQKELLYEIQ